MPLMEKIQHKTAIIGVVGLGYVGLPLAVAFAEAGFRVIGIDVNQRRLETLHERVSYISDIDSSRVETVVNQGKFQAVNWEQSGKADIFIVCVPTPITEDKKPNLSYITEATQQIKRRLTGRDSMVVLESSTYPSTTRDVVLPILGGSAKYVAYSPERVDPGSREHGLKNTPKLVAGINKKSTILATKLYRHIVNDVFPVPSPEVAETAKLYENVFRNVNIALANEMALICEKIGVSVWEVIDAAATKPFGFMPFYPGPGVSGHCVPVDIHYLIDKANESGAYTNLMNVSTVINEDMPINIAYRVGELLQRQQDSLIRGKVLILGVAFKRDVADTRESAPVKLMNILSSWGADVLYNDPYVPRLSDRLVSEELDDELLESADCVVIATDHSCYNWKRIVEKARMVFDTRNATKGIANSKIYRLGERRTR